MYSSGFGSIVKALEVCRGLGREVSGFGGLGREVSDFGGYKRQDPEPWEGRKLL